MGASTKSEAPLKVLLVAPNRSSFIHQDYLNLKENFDTDFVTCWSPGQILKTLAKVRNTDVCFFWFASIRFIPVFLLAKALNKKTIVVAGGYDVSRIPELGYGGIKPWSLFSFFRKIILHFCDKVVTVSNSNTMEAIENAQVPSVKIERIYLGLDKPKLKLKDWTDRKNQVVFIASCDETSYKIKGFDIFLALAKAMPDCTFVHIGTIHVQDFQKKCYELPNIRTLGWLENMSPIFSEVLNDSKVILLPSLIESFGVCILEGGLHGCVPVASNTHALPEIIGNSGAVCPLHDTRCFESAILDAITTYKNVNDIQNSFSERFSTKTRKDSLVRLLKSFF
jgi:glycosyltransferase involved in cell wall biosynthesis